MSDPIILDAGKFSSVGTLLRCALAFSSITQKPFVMEKIALDNKFPGLTAQKVALIDAFGLATSAKVSGNGVGSTVLQFFPSLPFSSKSINMELSSSSAVALPLHSFILTALFIESKITINLSGGTHLKNSPSISFINNTLLRYLNPYFESISLSVPVVGFYPKGEGLVSCVLKSDISLGDKIRPLIIKKKPGLVALRGEFISSNERLDSDVLSKLTSLISLSLKTPGVPFSLQPQYVKSSCSGASVSLFALFGDADGYDNFSPFIIASDKTWSSLSSIDKSVLDCDCLSFVKDFSALLTKGLVDIHSAELLLPFIALLGGSIDVSVISDVMKSAIYVSKELLGVDFEIVESKSSINISSKGYLIQFYDSLPKLDDL